MRLVVFFRGQLGILLLQNRQALTDQVKVLWPIDTSIQSFWNRLNVSIQDSVVECSILSCTTQPDWRLDSAIMMLDVIHALPGMGEVDHIGWPHVKLDAMQVSPGVPTYDNMAPTRGRLEWDQEQRHWLEQQLE